MKTGIIVYSYSGNTRQAAQKLLETMLGKGWDAELMEVKAANPSQKIKMSQVQLTAKPDVEGFDRLVFASPVWAFSLSGVMRAYLGGLPALKSKEINLFVTHQLPLPWMGGNKAIRQMKTLCEAKGGQVTSDAIISWSNKRRERDIVNMLRKLG